MDLFTAFHQTNDVALSASTNGARDLIRGSLSVRAWQRPVRENALATFDRVHQVCQTIYILCGQRRGGFSALRRRGQRRPDSKESLLNFVSPLGHLHIAADAPRKSECRV